MNASTRTKATPVILLALLCACAGERVSGPLSFPSQAASVPAPPLALPGKRSSFASVDVYKNDVAEHIMRYNRAHTFSGQLPPMLPAIVVLRITVDKGGRITTMFVQRSRDDQASRVALASMQRSVPLPKPFNLIGDAEKFLTFSETFLFNADYRFQLRSLAGPQ